MEILKTLSWTIIDKYREDGLLKISKHPTKSLWILNYTQKVQFERLWDSTLLLCRGLVVDFKGTIISRSFEKFFNVSEHEDYDFLSTVPNDTSFQTFEKLDGSLGILFNYKGVWIFSSRGSFESDQAIKGREILDKKGKVAFDDNTKSSLWDKLSKDNTYIFEILYHENKIVVDYGDREDVVLLGVIDTKSGDELSYGEMKIKYSEHLSIVPRYDGFADIEKLKEVQEDNKEGFVLRFGNGLRMKLKFHEYVRLHKIVTNISNKVIWEHLKDGLPFDEMIEKVPDEFFRFVKRTKADLEKQYNDIEIESLKLFLKTYIELGANIEIKKEFALKVKDTKYSGILFNMYNNKDYSNNIWMIIKPKYSKPFNNSGVDEG